MSTTFSVIMIVILPGNLIWGGGPGISPLEVPVQVSSTKLATGIPSVKPDGFSILYSGRPEVASIIIVS